MNEITDLIQKTMGPYMLEICMAFMATVLTLYDDDITILIKKRVKAQPFLLRVMIFVLLCAFVYGFLTVIGAKGMARVFERAVPPIFWIPLLVVAFFIVGVIAERKRQI